jgi:thiosulfate/3-mercaptopyruvate sulfurtransferase
MALRRALAFVPRRTRPLSTSASAGVPDLLQPAELAELARRPSSSGHLRIIDCGSGEAFSRARVPGAVRLLSEGPLVKESRAPTWIMDAQPFGALAAAMGVGSDSHVVVYDGGQGWAAAYVWWAFRYYGHGRVSVLDGGFPRWAESGAGRVAVRADPQLDAVPTPSSVFVPSPDGSLLATADDVLDILRGEGGSPQILDSRTQGEYLGTDLRGNARGGHVPGAINVPHGTLLNPDGSLKEPRALAEVFSSAGIDLSRPAVTYCQMGMRGALALLALRRAGAKAHLSNYDGSMREWLNAQDPAEYPVSTVPPVKSA